MERQSDSNITGNADSQPQPGLTSTPLSACLIVPDSQVDVSETETSRSAVVVSDSKESVESPQTRILEQLPMSSLARTSSEGSTSSCISETTSSEHQSDNLGHTSLISCEASLVNISDPNMHTAPSQQGSVRSSGTDRSSSTIYPLTPSCSSHSSDLTSIIISSPDEEKKGHSFCQTSRSVTMLSSSSTSSEGDSLNKGIPSHSQAQSHHLLSSGEKGSKFKTLDKEPCGGQERKTGPLATTDSVKKIFNTPQRLNFNKSTGVCNEKLMPDKTKIREDKGHFSSSEFSSEETDVSKYHYDGSLNSNFALNSSSIKNSTPVLGSPTAYFSDSALKSVKPIIYTISSSEHENLDEFECLQLSRSENTPSDNGNNNRDPDSGQPSQNNSMPVLLSSPSEVVAHSVVTNRVDKEKTEGLGSSSGSETHPPVQEYMNTVNSEKANISLPLWAQREWSTIVHGESDNSLSVHKISTESSRTTVESMQLTSPVHQNEPSVQYSLPTSETGKVSSATNQQSSSHLTSEESKPSSVSSYAASEPKENLHSPEIQMSQDLFKPIFSVSESAVTSNQDIDEHQEENKKRVDHGRRQETAPSDSQYSLQGFNLFLSQSQFSSGNMVPSELESQRYVLKSQDALKTEKINKEEREKSNKDEMETIGVVKSGYDSISQDEFKMDNDDNDINLQDTLILPVATEGTKESMSDTNIVQDGKQSINTKPAFTASSNGEQQKYSSPWQSCDPSIKPPTVDHCLVRTKKILKRLEIAEYIQEVVTHSGDVIDRVSWSVPADHKAVILSEDLYQRIIPIADLLDSDGTLAGGPVMPVCATPFERCPRRVAKEMEKERNKTQKQVLDTAPPSTSKTLKSSRKRKRESDPTKKVTFEESSPKRLRARAENLQRATKNQFSNGMHVFSRWRDGFFYPGTITEGVKIRENCYVICFDDGDVQEVSAECIIDSDALTVGQEVLVKDDKKWYREGAIVGTCRISAKESGYLVCLADSNQISKVAKQNIVLSPSQSKSLAAPAPVAQFEKERMAQIPESTSEDNPKPNKRMRTRVQRDKSRKSRDLPNDMATTSSDFTDVRPKRIRKVAAKTKENGHDVLSRSSLPSSPAVSEGEDDCVSPRDKDIFRGLAFLLTKGDKKKRSKNGETVSSEGSEAENLTNCIPFNRKLIKQRLEEGGGVVFSKPPSDIDRDRDQFVLIADRYQTTQKYLFALAVGMPILNYTWVIVSCKENIRQDFNRFLLPAGKDLLTGQVLELYHYPQPLKDVKVYVHDDSVRLPKWYTILEAAGADVVRRLPPNLGRLLASDSQLPHICDVVIVVTQKQPLALSRKARILNIPTVTDKWLVQCLLLNRFIDPRAHEKLRFIPTK